MATQDTLRRCAWTSLASMVMLASTAQAQPATTNLIEKRARAVVKVLNLGLPGVTQDPRSKVVYAQIAAGHGSGVVISSDCLVMTNDHVVRNDIALAVRFENDPTTYAAKKVHSSAKWDVALLAVEKPRCTNVVPLGTANTTIGRGERVWKMGYGGALPGQMLAMAQANVKEGTISSRRVDKTDNTFRYEISAAINPGDSGGLVMDTRGNMVGLTYAKHTKAESTGFVIPAALLKRLRAEADRYGYLALARKAMRTPEWPTMRMLADIGASIVEKGPTVRSMELLEKILQRNNKVGPPAMIVLAGIEWNYAQQLYSQKKMKRGDMYLKDSAVLVRAAVKSQPALRQRSQFANFVLKMVEYIDYCKKNPRAKKCAKNPRNTSSTVSNSNAGVSSSSDPCVRNPNARGCDDYYDDSPSGGGGEVVFGRDIGGYFHYMVGFYSRESLSGFSPVGVQLGVVPYLWRSGSFKVGFALGGGYTMLLTPTSDDVLADEQPIQGVNSTANLLRMEVPLRLAFSILYADIGGGGAYVLESGDLLPTAFMRLGVAAGVDIGFQGQAFFGGGGLLALGGLYIGF